MKYIVIIGKKDGKAGTGSKKVEFDEVYQAIKQNVKTTEQAGTPVSEPNVGVEYVGLRHPIEGMSREPTLTSFLEDLRLRQRRMSLRLRSSSGSVLKNEWDRHSCLSKKSDKNV